MEVRRQDSAAGPVVRGFRGTAYLVGESVFEGGVILTPEAASALDGALTMEAIAPALALDPPPEFLLLGTGPALIQPDAALRAELADSGIGLEAMDSRAAARAWRLLRDEGRWISAVLLGL